MKISIWVALVLFGNICFGQKICINNNPLFEFIYSYPTAISAIDNYNPNAYSKFLELDNKHLVGNKQRLVKTKDKLFIIIDGTGIVYQAISSTKENICFERIDSTYFTGYNGNEVVFEKNDTLFSFGGIGLWRNNGQLRYFSELNHEWNITPINKEVPVQNILYQLSNNNTKLYYLQIPTIDEATGISQSKYNIVLLDLLKRKNTELGELNSRIAKFYPDLYQTARVVNVPSLNGTLICYNVNNIFLFDFKDNQIYRLINPKIKDVFFGNSNGDQAIHLFESNKRIFYCRSRDSTYQLYSFPISMNDFVKESHQLYTQNNPFYENRWLILSGMSLVLLIGLGIFYLRKKKKIIISEYTSDEVAPTEIEFNPTELELILKMAGIESKAMTVEDINTALGLSKKTIEIQKKIRTETINRINHKFKIIFNTSDELIERMRMEDDRRYYTYKMKGENKKIILSFYKNSK